MQKGGEKVTNNNQQEELLYEISMLSFICVELNLYLDTHVHDQEAIQYFQYYNRLYQQAKREYSIKYGPLTVSDSDIPGASKHWTWATTEFPF